MSKLPLNGSKTHPLSDHARSELAMLGCRDRPAQEVNPGVTNRLLRDGYVEIFTAPTPYKTRKGYISWLRITEAGRTALTRSNKDDRHGEV